MPVSRFLIPLVSTVWIFSVMGGMGMHVLAEQPTEVQAVRRQFSTLEEVTAVQVQEEGSTVRFLPGEGEEVCVRYAASSLPRRRVATSTRTYGCTRFRSRTAPWSSKN